MYYRRCYVTKTTEFTKLYTFVWCAWNQLLETKSGELKKNFVWKIEIIVLFQLKEVCVTFCFFYPCTNTICPFPSQVFTILLLLFLSFFFIFHLNSKSVPHLALRCTMINPFRYRNAVCEKLWNFHFSFRLKKANIFPLWTRFQAFACVQAYPFNRSTPIRCQIKFNSKLCSNFLRIDFSPCDFFFSSQFSCKRKKFPLSSEQFSSSTKMRFSLFGTFGRILAYFLLRKMASYISLVLWHGTQLNIFTEVKFFYLALVSFPYGMTIAALCRQLELEHVGAPFPSKDIISSIYKKKIYVKLNWCFFLLFSLYLCASVCHFYRHTTSSTSIFIIAHADLTQMRGISIIVNTFTGLCFVPFIFVPYISISIYMQWNNEREKWHF